MTKGELRRELDLPGGDFSSVANDVSDDGLVVVGSSNGASGREAFRFTVLDGPHGIGQMEGLGIPSGAPSSSGKRVSSDGSVIVGRSETGAFESYRWEAGVMSLLPGLPGDSSSTYTGFGAKGVSGDGSVVVGASDSANGPEGYVWSAQTGQVVGIGDLPGGSFFSAARDVSYDGTIVVGLSEGYTIPKSGTQSATHAIRWTANTGLEVLWSNGYAEATSADGSVVVGYHEYVGQMPHSGVRWTRETGAVMMPGMLTWSISGDGSVIGGVAADRAAIWDEVHGVRNLQQVLSTDYGIVLDAGWHLDNVYGISYDGSTIVGLATNPQGFQEGYIVHLAQGRGITVTPTAGLETSESGAATTFSVVLKTQPTADVTIGVSSTDTTEGTVSATSLVFTVSNWNVPQIVTVTGVDDAVADGNQPYTIQLAPAVSTDPDYNGLNAADVTVTNLDNDTPPTKFFVVDDGTANQTFEYSVSGSPIESYALGSANATPRGVATTAAGDKVWVVDANRTVYVYDAAGTTLGSWSAGSLASNAIPEGIATNGTDLWIVDNKSDKVF